MPIRALVASLVVAAAATLTPPAAVAAPDCNQPRFRAVYLSGQVMALQGRGGRLAVCDLATGALRVVDADGSLADPGSGGARLSDTRFVSSGAWLGVGFSAGGTDRLAAINVARGIANAADEPSSRMVAIGDDGRLVYEVSSTGVFILDPDGRSQEILNPSVWAGGLTLASRPARDPLGYWVDRDGITSASRFEIGRIREPELGLAPVYRNEGECAPRGYRLAYADGVARVLQHAKTGSALICHSRTGVIQKVDAGQPDVELSHFRVSGGYLLLGVQAPDADKPAWVVHEIKAAEDARVVADDGRTYHGMNVTRRGTAVYGVGRSIKATSFQGEVTTLSESAAKANSVALDTSGTAYWVQAGRAESEGVR